MSQRYIVGDLWDQVPFINDCLYYGEELVKATANTNLTIIFGNVGIDERLRNLDGNLRKYNALYVASKGQLVSNPSQPYPFTIKTLLPCYRYFNEPRHFTSANVVAKERNLPLSDINQLSRFALDKELSLLLLLSVKIAGIHTIQIALQVLWWSLQKRKVSTSI